MTRTTAGATIIHALYRYGANSPWGVAALRKMRKIPRPALPKVPGYWISKAGNNSTLQSAGRLPVRSIHLPSSAGSPILVIRRIQPEGGTDGGARVNLRLRSRPRR